MFAYPTHHYFEHYYLKKLLGLLQCISVAFSLPMFSFSQASDKVTIFLRQNECSIETSITCAYETQGWWKVSANFSQVFRNKNLTSSHSPKKNSQVLKNSHKNFLMSYNLKNISTASTNLALSTTNHHEP